jgi:hypothetical protein
MVGPMTSEATRYRFHPLERRGVVLGLGPAQLVTVAIGVLVALGLLRDAQGGAAVVGGLGSIGVAVGLACWPVGARPIVAWAPVIGRWLMRTGRRRSLWSPDRTLAPVGIALLAAPDVPGEDPVGVVHDRLTGAWSAVLAVGSRSFSLLDVEDKQRRLAAWGAVLASAARTGSPVHRLQWVERAHIGGADTLGDYLRDRVAGPDGPAVASYGELVGRAGAATQRHEVLVVLSVHPRHAGRHLRAFGRGPAATCALLRRELRLLQGQLRRAEVVPGRPLDLGRLAGVLRDVTDPGQPSAGPVRESAAWPMAVQEEWASVRVDDRWHATYWVAEWPRVDVGADFLSPLLLVGGSRSVSLTMAPVPPAQAIREVQSARTADLADAELRRRAGFLSTARHRREAEGALHRENELADGHGDYRFCGYVSTSANSALELDGVCAELEQAAQQSHLELRRLFGQQRDALTWTMPLARGLS